MSLRLPEQRRPDRRLHAKGHVGCCRHGSFAAAVAMAYSRTRTDPRPIVPRAFPSLSFSLRHVHPRDRLREVGPLRREGFLGRRGRRGRRRVPIAFLRGAHLQRCSIWHETHTSQIRDTPNTTTVAKLCSRDIHTPKPRSLLPPMPLDPSDGRTGSIVPSGCFLVWLPSGWVISSDCGVP